MCIEDSLIWNVFASSSIAALFALPFSGAYVERVDVSWEKYLGEFDEFAIAYY